MPLTSIGAPRAPRVRGVPNNLNLPDWALPSGMRPDDLAVPSRPYDDLPVGLDVEDLPDADMAGVPDDWASVIPTDVTMRPGEMPSNLDGMANSTFDLEPTLRDPLPSPDDMPGTRVTPRIEPDAGVRVPDEALEPARSSAMARALALATLGVAGGISMYDFFPPGSGTPGGYTPVGRPGASPPGGFPPGFDPPFPPGPLSQDADQPANRSNWSDSRRRGVDEERMIGRLANRAGIPYDQAEKLIQAEYVEQGQGHVIGKKDAGPDFDQRKQAYKPVRTMGRSLLDANQRARKAEVVRQAQLRSNPTALLSPEMREFVIAQNIARDPRLIGASPFDVRKAEAEADAMMQSRLGLSRGAQANPVADQAVAEARQASRVDMMKAADDYVTTNFSGRKFYSAPFTPEAQQATATWLMATYGLSQLEANDVVSVIAQTRRKPADVRPGL